jgi:hypothetical protein
MTPDSAPQERIFAVVGNLTHLGGFMGTKQKAFSLIITDRRIVFAELSRETIAELVREARDDAKAEGKSLLGRLGAQSRASSHYHERYWQIHPDMALGESPENFAIERAAIKKVKFKTGTVDETHSQSDQVTIKTTSGKYKLQVNGSLSAAKEAFRAAGLG